MNSFGTKCGILGGGQLAQMLAQSAARLGCEAHALSEKSSDPVAQVSGFWRQGSASKTVDVKKFAAELNYLTFESEFFSAETLQKSLSTSKAFVFPKLDCLSVIQDRARQKSLLDEYDIPTAPFIVIQESEDFARAWQVFGPHVLKTRRGGYDGYGTFPIKKSTTLNSELQKFVEHPGFIAEEMIAFKKECAVILVRSRQGEKLALPLVESQQKESRCDWVSGPIYHKAWPSLQKKLFRMMDQIDYVGVLAAEFFDTGTELLVNELAPRVHNSGHYSLNSLNFSQFDLHWMAGLGLNLPEIKLFDKTFLMMNLIGKSNLKSMSFPSKISGNLHWYGKHESRPGRKLGHVNYNGKVKSNLLKQALKERSLFKL